MRTVRLAAPNQEMMRARARRAGGVLLLRRVEPRARPADVTDLHDRRDIDLMERLVAADEDAFAELFRRYGAVAFALATRVLADRTLAEEVVQEVFLSVWRKARNYDEARGSVRAWLLTQVHHRAVDVVRREEAERRRPTPATAEDPTPDDVIEDHWLASRREQVRSVLDVLPPEQRSVIELCYFEGLTQSQVASRLGTPLGTVKSRTVTAMKRMREALVARTGEAT